jgi:hypothetical protein
MRWMGRVSVMVTCCLAMSGAAQPIRFYEFENFAGQSYAAATTIDNFEHFGFNDRASSVEVRSGRWQLCTDADFRGHCAVLGPGTYPSLRTLALDNRISSARPMSGAGPGPGPGSDWSNASVVLYELEYFSGRTFPVSTAVANLASVGFNDRVSSLDIRRGRWQFCSDAFYFGQCQVLGPESYRTLSSFGMNNRISSLRPLDGGPGAGPPQPAITVYDRTAMNGQSMTVTTDVNDLAHMRFDHRMRSIEVSAGRWMLCSEAFFRGQCRTFGPGRYGSLGSLDRRVSSLRITG